jgi:hypothetical protein
VHARLAGAGKGHGRLALQKHVLASREAEAGAQAGPARQWAASGGPCIQNAGQRRRHARSECGAAGGVDMPQVDCPEGRKVVHSGHCTRSGIQRTAQVPLESKGLPPAPTCGAQR